MKERCILNTPDKPIEAGHLSIPEYNRFYVWWEENHPIRSNYARECALEAYKYALENVDYGARY